MAIQVKNTAQAGKSPGWYQWTVFLEGPPEELDRIKEVQYTLHPTFRKPVQVVRERGAGGTGFALEGAGWGEFEIRLKIVREDDEVETMEHGLDLST